MVSNRNSSPIERSSQKEETSMEVTPNSKQRSVNRRSLLKGGLLAGGATLGAGLLGKGTQAFAQDDNRRLNSGNVAILRFLAAAELIESDLWTQYAELGGIGKNLPPEVDQNQTLNPYQA